MRSRASIVSAAALTVLLAFPVLEANRAVQVTSAPSKTRAQVTMLASVELEGRMTGSRGEKLASDFIVGELRKIGAKPLPGHSDFLMPFDFTAGTRDGGSRMTVTSGGTTRTRSRRPATC